MGIKRVFGPDASGGGGGGATGDLALVTGGLAARSDLNPQNLTANATGGTAGYTYAWTCTRPDGSASTSEFTPNASAQNPTFTPARVGLYAVTCTVTDSTSGTPLTASSTQSKTVGTVLSVAIGGLANSATLAAQSLTATPTGGTGSPTYSWSCIRPNNTSSTTEFTPNATTQNPNFTPASSGLHKVQCVITDSSSATATANVTADVGTGIINYPRNQLVDLTGWTKFTGALANAQFATAAAITANSGTFTFGYSNLLDPSGNPDDPVATLNAPKEYGCGYYSPASILDSVPFDRPGVLTIRLEQASVGTGTSTSGQSVDGKMFVAVGICNGPYNGNDNTVDFYSMLLYTNFSGGNFKPYVSAGNETASNTTGATRTASPAGTGVVDLFIMINNSGNPTASVNYSHYGSTSFPRDTTVSASGTDQFAVTDDTRMWVAIGSHSTSTAQSASQDFRIYWSYSRIGA